MRVYILTFTCLLAAAAVRAEPADAELFTRKVRPILAQHCFKCHGPDDKARKARLRLDDRDSALRPARSRKRAIVPGKPDKSELVARIFSDDETEVMPPPHTRNPLSDEDKRVLRQWIEAGAPYAQHWAFLAPRQAPLPQVRKADWPRNAIDRFVLARLEREGLSPALEADRYTLVRRLYLDLIGLPPTPEEADTFVNDPATDAYERLVDRLLASPRYGERWARRWLDLARYADTNGYEKDRPRSIWPYRDWVINALNADMPFDRFTTEQIAGDMLPNATIEQRIATGFHRNTMLNEEGGIDPLEFRFHAMTDRMATTGIVWLGLTVGCAQCHTHKYDPIPHQDYYRLMAFLNNADEPQIDVPRDDVRRRRQEIDSKIAELSVRLADSFPVADDKHDSRPLEVRRREQRDRKFNEWLARETARTVHWTVLRPIEARSSLPHLSVQKDDSVLASGDQSKSDTYHLTFRTGLRGITALRVEALPDDSLPAHGPGRVYYEGPPGDFQLSEISLTAGGRNVPFARASHSHAAGGATAQAAIDGNQQTGWSINGGQGRPHNAVFVLASPLTEVGVLDVKMLFERYYAAGLGRFRISVTTDPHPAARAMPAEIERLLLVPADRRTAEQRQQLFEHFLSVAPELAPQRKAIEALRKQKPAYPTTLVLAERPADNPRPTYIHNRGEFLQAGQRVEPAVLSILPPLPRDAPRNRLGLARWLVSPDNPLVGRVTMNRQWAAFFGRGLVATLQDFGFQGEPPSHPELLDWLAVEFVRQAWSVKKMHRLMVMSATYRQSSRVTPQLSDRDPDNRLLARGPRVRLEAEQVRDAALAAAGLLSSRMGGPSVFPAQPPGVTTEGAYGQLEWKVSPGQDRHRRGLYTFSKRTTPYAMTITFDGPSGEVCLARREVSNTPLQALTLLNDPVFTEVAQALGSRMAAHSGTIEERVVELFRRCLTRLPTARERSQLVSFYQQQKQHFQGRPQEAAALAGAGAGDAIERAAWTALARVLLNLDEAITRG